MKCRALPTRRSSLDQQLPPPVLAAVHAVVAHRHRVLGARAHVAQPQPSAALLHEVFRLHHRWRRAVAPVAVAELPLRAAAEGEEDAALGEEAPETLEAPSFCILRQ